MKAKIIAAVLGFLGISAFAKDEKGESLLTDDQRKMLTEKWGDKFVASFEATLKDVESENQSAESVITESVVTQMKKQAEADKTTLENAKKEIDTLKEKNASLEAEKKSLTDDNAKLGEKKVETTGEKVGGGTEVKKNFKADMTYVHNQSYFERAQGRSYTGDTTIDTTELQTEFGRYISSDKYEIFNKLVSPLVDTEKMQTIITDKFVMRATHAQITSVLQSFVPQWTPKGKSTFTPLTITQYPMKINVPIIPSDIIDEVLGYLYDENLKPEEMPIVRYIVEILVKPLLDEERQTAFAVGIYKEPVADEHGVFTANSANQVMNGYLTQLCVYKRDGNGGIVFIKCNETFPTASADIVKFMEDFCDSDDIKAAYKNRQLNIHADPDIIKKYSRAYREVYKDTKNQDGEKVQIDYTKFFFTPMEGMRGTGAFFITPKENFKHLMSGDPKTKSLRMEHLDYTAKVFGEWREGVGFWIGEAIFAYIPAATVTQYAPTVEGEGV